MGKNKMTIDDVANALGISKTTVSRALSGKGRISESTKDRVREYVEKNGYFPNGIAKCLANKRTYNIAVTWSGDYEVQELPYFQNCLNGIMEIMSSENIDVVISMCVGKNIDNLKRIVSNKKVDGVILTRSLVDDAALKYLKSVNMPFVTIGTSEYDGVVQIDNDHFKACRDLTKKLIEMGHKKIALLGGSSNHVITKTRYGGFVKAFHETHTLLDTSIIYLDVNTDKRIENILNGLINSDVSCLICMDDAYAMRVIDICKKEHIRIPNDLKLASFYDSVLLSSSIPRITSLSFNDKNLGMASARMLLSMINGESVQSKMVENYELNITESTSISKK